MLVEANTTDLVKGGFPEPESSFSRLAGLEEGNFWFQNRNRLICWMMKKHFPNVSRFLEIGCGTGFVLSGIKAEFPGIQLTGAELHAEGLEFAKSRLPEATFVQLDATRMPFRDSYDVVGAFDVLEHIDQDVVALGEIKKALTVGGGLLITVPQHGFLWSRADEFACHVRRYSRRELVQKVSAAGFDVVFCTSFVSWLLPILVCSRLLERNSRAPYDPLGELKLSAFVNWIFGLISFLEQATIRLGLSYAAGGSLLLVARSK